MHAANRLAISLLVIGVLAAAANLFAPSERVAGIDLGATGSVVFVLTLIAAVALFARRGRRIFPEDMSLTESRAWVALVFLALMLVMFVREILLLSEHAFVPVRISEALSYRFIFRYVLLVGAWAIISGQMGRGADIETDERDLQMRHRADRAGDWALTLLVIFGIVALISYPPALLAWWLEPIVLANVLIGLLIAKALVEHAALVYQYRRA